VKQTTAMTGEGAWLVGLRRVNEEEASRFGPGQGRPWGRVARVSLRSKAKRRERSNFGREWQLGAANGDGGGRRSAEFTGWKSSPVKEKSALRAARKVVVVTGKILAEGKSAKRRPTCKFDTWGTLIRLPDLRLGHPSSTPQLSPLRCASPST
jgi:hypothetical protein